MVDRRKELEQETDDEWVSSLRTRPCNDVWVFSGTTSQ